MSAPNTGNTDCDTFIRQTFVREEHNAAFPDIHPSPRLIIKAHPYETSLTEDQVFELIRYLKEAFCRACRGTGKDPEAWDGRCEFCNPDMPF